jgi:phosphohistidine swiveling domain-containing protein
MNKSIKWFVVVSFRTELLTEYACQKGLDLLPGVLGTPKFFNNRKNVDNDICNDEKEYKEFSDYIKKDYKKLLPHFEKIIKNESMKLLKISKETKRFSEFYEQYEKCAGLIGIPNTVEVAMMEVIREKLKGFTEEEINDFLTKVSFSKKKTKVYEERTEALKIGKEKIKEHVRKYGWIHKTLFLGKEYTEEKFLEDIENPEKKLEELNENEKKQEEIYEETIKKVRPELREDIKLLQELIYFRNIRLEWLNEACHNIKPLFLEIAKKLGISYEQLIYMLPYEIIESLEKGLVVDKKELDKRIKKYALVRTGKDIKLYTGEEVEKFRVKNDKTTELRGFPASPGIVKGKVRIVKDRTELEKVQKGDILVTRLTTPDFVTAMEKAAAIITDIGGVTSHAAIVSRELNKPCITGTKNATKTLKNGQIIEVDANKGIITPSRP